MKKDCDFDTEVEGRQISCQIEGESRTMYAKWIPKTAHVMEVGARYGQTTCVLSSIVTGSGSLHSVEADPKVWNVLEANLRRKGCAASLVKGVVGSRNATITFSSAHHSYGTQAVPEPCAKHPRADRPCAEVPAHSWSSLGAKFDTLAMDCEGCFSTMLSENPGLQKGIKLIVVEVHNDGEKREVERLLAEGWKQVGNLSDHYALCAPGAKCEIQDKTCP